MTLKHFPTIEQILKSYYPLLDTNGWIEDEFPETGDTSFETECDNFPVSVDGLILFLEAVFYLVPTKKYFWWRLSPHCSRSSLPNHFLLSHPFLRKFVRIQNTLNR